MCEDHDLPDNDVAAVDQALPGDTDDSEPRLERKHKSIREADKSRHAFDDQDSVGILARHTFEMVLAQVVSILR